MNNTNLDIQAFSEVKCILDFLPISYTEKLPKKLLNIINNLYDEKYKINIKPDIALKKQNFTEDTKNIIAVLKYNYWCKNKEEKENLANIFKKNEEEYQEDLREKYNVDNIFKNKKSDETINNVLPVVIKKDNLFTKLLNIIKDFFKRM